MNESQSDKKRNREVYLDVVCGIMIIWMILGHLIASCGLRDSVIYTIGNRLFPFFMPWFFFKSGMFYKKRPFKQVVISWGGQLLIPYFAFCLGTFILFHLYSLLKVGSEGFFMGVKGFLLPIIHTGAPINNIALWFLLTLFLCKTFFCLLATLRVPSVAIAISMGLLAIVVYSVKPLLRDNDIEIPYYVVNTITGVCFYAMGYGFRDLQFKSIIFYISLFVHIIILTACFSFVDMFKNVLVVGYYPVWLISSVSGCVIINNLFRELCKYTSLQLLYYVGRNSMVFYATHLWIIVIVNGRLLPYLGIKNAIVCFIINTAACVILLPLANVIFRTNVLRWMIGEKQ